MKHTWNEHNKKLVKGDILRAVVKNPHHKKKGQYAYAICSGGGFGCNPGSLGNAIFVDHVGFDLDQVVQDRQKAPDPAKQDRWEKFWNVEYLVDEDDKATCSICRQPLGEEYGNNAEPINPGTCCDTCKIDVVIPARVANSVEDDHTERRGELQ